MLSALFDLISKYIVGLFWAVVICIVAFPIGVIGLCIHERNFKAGFTGIFIMFVIYVLIYMFVPKFFLISLLGLIPLILGIFGLFVIPDLDF